MGRAISRRSRHSCRFQPDPNERTILQRWLAARYRRPAFPDEFDRRLDETGLRDRLGDLRPTEPRFQPSFSMSTAVSMWRGPARTTHMQSAYICSTARKSIRTLLTKQPMLLRLRIRKAFLEKCSGKDGVWLHIELVECEAIADRAMTVHEAEHLRRWTADHISLRAGPAIRSFAKNKVSLCCRPPCGMTVCQVRQPFQNSRFSAPQNSGMIHAFYALLPYGTPPTREPGLRCVGWP